MSMLKVCLMNDSFPPDIDGVANVTANYADELCRRPDTGVIVATPEYPGTDYKSLPYPVVTYPSIDTSALTGGYRTGYPFLLSRMKAIMDFHPDILHTHCPVTSCLLARAIRDTADVPLVITYHTKYDVDIRSLTDSTFIQDESIRLLVRNVTACDEVWTVSAGAGENLRSLGYEGNYKVVLNGVDFPKGRIPADEVEAAVRGYDLPAGVPVFLFVGRLMEYKGLPLIIKALRGLAQTDEFRMVLIGRGADEEKLKRMIREYGIACDERDSAGNITSVPGSLPHGKIIFTGPVSDRQVLRAWNTRADLFVFPSVFDTNGLVVREAAACGLASVLIRGSCAAEGITDGRNGFLINSDAEELAAFLKQACAHPEVMREAGARAMDEIYLSWHDAVGEAVKLYEDLVRRKKEGLLKRKQLADDPLFETTAEAVRKYIEVTQNELPQYEGMLDNLQEIGQAILDDIEDRKNDLEKRIRQRLKL